MQDLQLTRILHDKIISPTQNICLNILFSCEHKLSVMTPTVSELEGGTVHLFFTPKA